MIQFTVFGVPQSQGSKTPFKLPNGRVVLTEAVKGLKPWRSLVALEATKAKMQAMIGEVYEGPVRVECVFFFVRGKTVKREHMTTKPDSDKLSRAILDAMTGVIYKDDSQVVELVASKRYDLVARALITVTKL